MGTQAPLSAASPALAGGAQAVLGVAFSFGIPMAFAAVQIVVHMIYFLHMNSKSEGGWTMLALIFTIIVVVIALAGSLWVMYHLNTNMMPATHDMSQIMG